MGRRDAVQFTLELAAEWRRLGALVTFEPGWETRGNGTSANYEGGSVHHTGFGSSETNRNPGLKTLEQGRPDLGPPLCNSTGPWCSPDQPHIHIVAAHPANHAGASGGKAMGPMPVTSLFNPRSWGHEIDYGGNVAMAPGQRLAALIVTKGLANVLQRSVEYVRAHAETSVTGKWDPGYAPGKTIDMAAFRRDAATLTGDDMPLTDDDIRRIWQHQIRTPDSVTTAETILANTEGFYNHAIPAIVTGILDAEINRSDLQRGPTTLRAVLTWSDNHVDALASGIAAAVSAAQAGSIAGPVDAAAVQKAVQDAVNNLTVKISAS